MRMKAVTKQRLMTMMSSIVLFIFLLSIGASFIQRTTGFGFGIFIMTMLPFLMPSYGEATTLSGLLAITTSAAIVWRLRSCVTWQRLCPILLTFIIVSTIAIFALTRIEDHLLRRILGVALILISIYFMLFSQRIKLPTTKKVQVGAGTLSGLMGGFFGMQGPPAVLYFIQSEPTKEHYMAMAQTLWPRRCHHRHDAGCLRFQAYPQPHLPLHRLCLYLHQRCNHTNYKLRTNATIGEAVLHDVVLHNLLRSIHDLHNLCYVRRPCFSDNPAHSIRPHLSSSPSLSYCLRLPTGGSVRVILTTAVLSRLRAIASSKASI